MKQRIYSAHPTVKGSAQKQRRIRTVADSSHSNLKDDSKPRERSSFVKKPRHASRSSYKEPEQLAEQNLHLKSFVNNLQEQLFLQKNRLQLSKRKNEKVTRQMNRQFHKEIYYSGKNPNSYLISGVKSQYQNVKRMYEQKCDDFEAVIRTLQSTNYQEMRAYIETLEKENIALVQQIDNINSVKNQYSDNFTSSHPKHSKERGKVYTEVEERSEASSKNMDVLMYQLSEERGNLGRAKAIIENYSQKIEVISRERDQQKKKIEFLQKLLIEKDNAQHDARKDLKKVEREKNQLGLQLVRIKDACKEREVQYTHKIQTLESRQLKKYEIERQIFTKSLKEKNQYIAKLEKEIKSLSAMLCYWKPLDEGEDDLSQQLNRQDSRKSRETKELLNDRPSLNRMRLRSQYNAAQSAYSDHPYMENAGRMVTDVDKSGLMEDSIKRTVTGNNRSSSLEEISSSKDKLQRPRKQCSKKYSERAVKTRKVNLNDIKVYGQLIRYRLVGHRVSYEMVKELFDQRMPSKGREDQYINMKTIKDILTQHPFSLSQGEAVSVSRYIVQDSSNEHVYWDEDNQISANVAKSIAKAFIGQYSLPELQKMNTEWKKIRGVYLNNLMIALRTLAPKGFITLEKFIELLVGLGIEMEDELQDWLVGQLVIVSPSLEELRYEVIQKL